MAAHWLYIRHSVQEGQRAVVRAHYERRAAGDREAACYALLARRPNSGAGSELPVVYSLARERGIGPCMTVLLAEMTPYAADVPGLPPSLELRRRATEIAGELHTPWVVLAGDLQMRRDSATADSTLDVALSHVRHPMSRVVVLSLRAWAAHERGRADIASARWRAIAAAVERDGRPGVELLHRYYRAQYVPGVASPREIQERVEFARRASLGTRFSLAYHQGTYAAASGDFADALPHYERARMLADSLGDLDARVDARLWVGRALWKMGRAAAAESELRAAVRLAAGSNLRYSTAEVWHNLAHTYESAGDLARAVAASDSFVVTAAALDRDPIRIISHRDAGMLRLTLGWHAAAHEQFDAMVRLINSERQNNYWAGEYYERVGNTRAALTFFHRGARFDHGERSLNLAGLVRVYEALGMRDSVAAAARDHDAHIKNATEVPLTPEVLSRAGRHREALQASRRWAHRREASNNVHGAATARLQVARLALAADDPRAARAEARLAARHATTLRLALEHIEALRLLGMAESRMRGQQHRAAALLLLGRAARLALGAGDVRLVRETHLALGLAHGDASAAALEAFDHAARAVESATSSLTDDVDRARYRAANLAPFDAAVRALLAAGETAAPQLAAWSSRRKAAALALATRNHPDSVTHVDAARLASRLGTADAVVDYLVVGDIVAALVFRGGAVRLVRLPVSGDTLETLARRMTAHFARRGGRVDLARLAFDEDAAERLYRGLVAPLRDALGDATRLTVIPDGAMHHVPFAALASGGRHVLDEFELDYAPSLSLATPRPPASWAAARLLLVRTDVPGAARERDAIVRAWPGPVRELANAAATEPAVLGAAAHAEVVHFATHAEASDRNPLTTHLRLSPGGAADGLLHLAEIGTARFAGRLVVLAACESSGGELFTGEGFMGLSRAFLAAGAPGVVATRWAVDESAAEFSAAFYAALAQGETVAAATRSAQLALRHRAATSHPFYWAGYVAVRASAP